MSVFIYNNNELFYKNIFIDIYTEFNKELNDELYSHRKYLKEINSLKEINGLNKQEQINKTIIIIDDIVNILDHIEEDNFSEKLFKVFINVLKQIRTSSVKVIDDKSHTEYCISLAIFDIIFKFSFDYIHNFTKRCCKLNEYKSLEFSILNDIRWKLTEKFN